MPELVTPPLPPSIPIPPPMTMEEEPCRPKAEGHKCRGEFYTIAEGDTLYMIARENGIPLQLLIDANRDVDFYNLQVGMELCIPFRDDCYYVRINDNLDNICNKFQVQPYNLMKVNPHLTIVDYSTPGTRICIPNR
jgi:hypothetical protein